MQRQTGSNFNSPPVATGRSLAGVLRVDRIAWAVELVADAEGQPALHWKALEAPEHRLVKRLTPRCLFDFAALADATPGEVVAFARRYGALGFCRHELPFPHPNDGSTCLDRIDPEPVRLYQRYAREVVALLNLSARIRQGSAGDRAGWALLAPGKLRSIHRARALVAGYIDMWCNSYVRIPLHFTWSEKVPAQLALHTITLWGELALALAAAVMRAEMVTLCAGCGRLFTPKRVQSGRLSWCSRCGKRGADREAQRRSRAKQRSPEPRSGQSPTPSASDSGPRER